MLLAFAWEIPRKDTKIMTDGRDGNQKALLFFYLFPIVPLTK